MSARHAYDICTTCTWDATSYRDKQQHLYDFVRVLFDSLTTLLPVLASCLVPSCRPLPLPTLVSFLPSRSCARFARFSYFPLPLYFLNFSPLSVLSPLFSLIPPSSHSSSPSLPPPTTSSPLPLTLSAPHNDSHCTVFIFRYWFDSLDAVLKFLKFFQKIFNSFQYYLHRVTLTDITSSPNVLEVLPVIIGTSVQIWYYVVSRICFLQKESLCLTRSFTVIYSTS